MRAHTIVHIDLGDLKPAQVLRCDHPDGRVSFELVDQDGVIVWITGTATDFGWFANNMSRLADRIRLEGWVPS